MRYNKLPEKIEDVGEVHAHYSNDTKFTELGRLDLSFVYAGYPTPAQARASSALCKLLFIRDIYNGAWQPDWDNEEIKYCIKHSSWFFVMEAATIREVLYFKSRDLAEKFMSHFYKELEIAKPLL